MQRNMTCLFIACLLSLLLINTVMADDVSKTKSTHRVLEKAITMTPHQLKKVTTHGLYNPQIRNVISSRQLNTLLFPYAIKTVVFPEGDVNQFHYLLNNKALTFTLANPNMAQLQIVVTLANNHLLSLHFSPMAIPGRLITVPKWLTGSKVLNKMDDPLATNIDESQYDKRLLAITRSVINHQLADNWQQTNNIHEDSLLDKTLRIKQYQRWESGDVLQIQAWKICAIVSDRRLTAAEFTVSRQALSATMTKNHLTKGNCTDFIVISKIETNNSKHSRLKPVIEAYHD